MQPIVSASILAHNGHEIPEVKLCGPCIELNHGREPRFFDPSGTGEAFFDDGRGEIRFEVLALGPVGVAHHLHGRIAEDGPRVPCLRQALLLHARQRLDLFPCSSFHHRAAYGIGCVAQRLREKVPDRQVCVNFRRCIGNVRFSGREMIVAQYRCECECVHDPNRLVRILGEAGDGEAREPSSEDVVVADEGLVIPGVCPDFLDGLFPLFGQKCPWYADNPGCGSVTPGIIHLVKHE